MRLAARKASTSPVSSGPSSQLFKPPPKSASGRRRTSKSRLTPRPARSPWSRRRRLSITKAEISLQEARHLDSEAEVGDEIGSLIEMDELGRIEAQTAKQVIFQKVREAEWGAVQKEYSTRQGD